MTTQKHRHQKLRHGATRRSSSSVSPRRWRARLNGWLTEPRLNLLVDIAMMAALFMVGLALAAKLFVP
ncbi:MULTISPECIES: hypothetical protein [Halomonadaceae]|jgi:hypothetical protein|uniref:hypothetical protein n=1 Tax=Halomonadaceae TaxID=28256 RepID=UPI001582CBDB|nr:MULTISPECIES: hypothetical protein [Halomonas]MDI4639095.1 hypothetical protein [Halomonas sp. BMC7]NUJ60086.1 hypothetical protein [Halomonas taeanensis]|tara:strand:+ start:18921 stop:19124 length:204 start_codon:yes stop_codon:yes gene_type:complete